LQGRGEGKRTKEEKEADMLSSPASRRDINYQGIFPKGRKGNDSMVLLADLLSEGGRKKSQGYYPPLKKNTWFSGGIEVLPSIHFQKTHITRQGHRPGVVKLQALSIKASSNE